MTAEEIITAAFQELGIVVAGGSPSSDNLTWGLGKFNRLLKTLSADGLNLAYKTEESFTLTDGTASYTIGSGADFDTARPNVITDAFIRQDSSDYPIDVRPIGEYWQIIQKSATSLPTKLYYQTTYPNGTVYLWLAPGSAYTLHIVSEKPLTTYASASTSVSVPGEYEDFLILKLAAGFAPRFGKSLSPEFVLNLRTAEENVLARNLAGQMKPVSIRITGREQGTYNINADE